MLILIVFLLVLVPAAAILYPFLASGRPATMAPEDEGSPGAELSRRWDAALEGLKNAELEHTLGNLDEEDHAWLKEQYVTEAALVMKAMELGEDQRKEMAARVERESDGLREGEG